LVLERSPNETLQLTALHASGCTTREALYAELRAGEHGRADGSVPGRRRQAAACVGRYGRAGHGAV